MMVLPFAYQSMNKLMAAFFLLAGCLVIPSADLWAQGVSVRNGRMSADLNGASLVSVATDIERQSGISFRGDQSLAEERVSATFEDLPIEVGIRRILAELSYSVLFDSQGLVSQVVIMSEEVNTVPASQPRRATVLPSASSLALGQKTIPVLTQSRTTVPRSTLPNPPQTATSGTQVPSGSNLPEPSEDD